MVTCRLLLLSAAAGAVLISAVRYPCCDAVVLATAEPQLTEEGERWRRWGRLCGPFRRQVVCDWLESDDVTAGI